METLKEIKEICEKTKCDACPFDIKPLIHCLFEEYPAEWDLEMINEALASNEPNNAHKGGR